MKKSKKKKVIKKKPPIRILRRPLGIFMEDVPFSMTGHW